ncbi:hypothetical protein TthHB5018_09080 [Thermus thermophilus]|uniref:Uncharacterized protein n=2 Tax=Thermus thermophilus TaxID=274 RepID=A0A7R7TD63_THETH|nr:hypothetical protein TthHB5018_09080 [Thermus thermophilus]
MGAIGASSGPYPEYGSKTTSTRELLPVPTKSYVEKTRPWIPWTLQDLSLFILLMEPLKSPQLLDFPEVSTSVFQQVESVMRWLVEEQVRLHDPRQIRDYLVEFPGLIELIPQAVQAAKKHLPEAQLILKVYCDPEIEDRYLALYVRLPRYDERVMKCIKAAEEEFIDGLANVQGWLQLTTDFREPEVG